MFFDVILPILCFVVIFVFLFFSLVVIRKESVSRIRMINEFYMYAKNKNNEIKEKKENV